MSSGGVHDRSQMFPARLNATSRVQGMPKRRKTAQKTRRGATAYRTYHAGAVQVGHELKDCEESLLTILSIRI
ncbi:uncharacterized protein TRAVEDRAFT_61287 [Trametes versicolor FP-101664 SS1]|uniref:uncharacterized protein n=1 Tax=Trametes versicolor (strain FP-101664) TaxID=717944 RepID=UPI0004623334|nr:uncharacterized protein TRAVEDRAFT_61287 [Trametes versicolor FP-101664 SS1]EIW52306.1 hypothetical protein TRAVEDRAFT_61287 [Trametes versicolor FP-101664 SS1]